MTSTKLVMDEIDEIGQLLWKFEYEYCNKFFMVTQQTYVLSATKTLAMFFVQSKIT